MPADDGDGTASVGLDKKTQAVVDKLAERTLSDPAVNVETGVDLGAGPGAGRITGEDLGGAADINEAAALAKAL